MTKSSPNKSFGIVMGIFFTLLFLYSMLKNNSAPNYYLLAIAILFFFCAFFLPVALTPLNYLWAKFGLLLHKITNPLILCTIYFGIFFPMGLLFKIFGKDPLRRKPQALLGSYWIIKNKSNQLFSMKDQF